MSGSIPLTQDIMRAVFNFIGKATKKTGHTLLIPVKYYLKQVAKNYESLYDKGYNGPFWM